MKALMQLMAAVLAAAMPAVVSEGPDTGSEWINVVLLGLGAATVWITANQPAGELWAYSKAFVSGLSASGVVLNSVLTEGITTTEWYQVAAAGIGVIATFAVPNSTASDEGGKHRAEPEVA